MRVLLITPYFYPKIGGVERHTYNIARGLTSLGHTVHVVTTLSDPDYAATETVDGITVTRMPIDYVVSMTPIGRSWARTLRRIIREFRPDVIEAHAPVPGLADLAYFLRRGTPYVIKYHSGDMRKGKNRLIDLALQIYQRTVLRHILTHADAIMSVYPDYVRSLVGKKSPIDFIPPGVDTTIFRPKKLKKKYDVLYVGRIEHASAWKGIDVLLDAVAIAKKRHKNIRVAMVGNGDAIEHFTNLAAELGVADNVEFLGTVQGEPLVDTYNRSRMLVLPSLTEAESFGNVLIEAMACRVPAIGSRVGGIPNVISDGDDGYLFAPGDDGELSRHISTLMNDARLRAKLGANGYQKVHQQFSADILNQKTQDVLQGVLRPPVVHVVAHYPPSVGGMQIAVEALVRHEGALAIDSSVITTDIDYSDAYVDSNRVKRLRAIEIFHTPIVPALLGALLRRQRGTILRVHIAQALLPEIAFVAARLKHMTYVAHFHADVGSSGIAGRLLPIYKKLLLGPLLRRSAAIIVPTESYRRLVIAKYRIKPDRITVIPTGVDDELFDLATTKLHSKSPIQLLYAGRLSVEKNVDLIIKSLAYLDRPAILTIVGDGALRDQLDALSRNIVSSNPRHRIDFVGHVPKNELIKYYANSHVSIVASDYESQSLFTVESLASGTPVVAHNVPALDEIIDSSVGRLVTKHPRDIADAISQIVSSTQSYSALSKTCRLRADNYRWSRIMQANKDLYDRLAAAQAEHGGES